MRSRPIGKSAAAAIGLGDLTFTLVALLRAEGHLCNVLTHISSGDWRAVEQSIAAILNSRASPKKLSNVARNILELICDDRGVTGRIMRPFFFEAIARIAGRREMERLEKQVHRLRSQMSFDAQARSARSRRLKKPADARHIQQVHVNPLVAPSEMVQCANGARP